MAEITFETLWIGLLQLITPAVAQIGIAIFMLITFLITRTLTQRHIIRHHLGDIIRPEIDLRDAKIQELKIELERLQTENIRITAAIKAAAIMNHKVAELLYLPKQESCEIISKKSRGDKKIV